MNEDIKISAPIVTLTEVAPSLETLYKLPPEPCETEDIHIDRKFQRRESILTSQVSLFVETTKPRIPDGGWGWLVVLACFVINVVSDGVAFCFGLLYIEFLNEYGASKSATSWVGSLFMALPLMAGKESKNCIIRYVHENMFQGQLAVL